MMLLKFSDVLQSQSDIQHANVKTFLGKTGTVQTFQNYPVFDWFFIGPQHMLYGSTTR
jgi:hypothetical protein